MNGQPRDDGDARASGLVIPKRHPQGPPRLVAPHEQYQDFVNDLRPEPVAPRPPELVSPRTTVFVRQRFPIPARRDAHRHRAWCVEVVARVVKRAGFVPVSYPEVSEADGWLTVAFEGRCTRNMTDAQRTTAELLHHSWRLVT